MPGASEQSTGARGRVSDIMNEDMNVDDEVVNAVVSSPLLRRWMANLYRSSEPIFDPNTLACDERLAFSGALEEVLTFAKSLPEFSSMLETEVSKETEEALALAELQPDSSSVSEAEVNKAILEFRLDCMAIPETLHAKIAGVSEEEFRKIRLLFSGSGLLRFEPVPENSFIWPTTESGNRFRIFLRWTPEVWKKVLIPISQTEEGRELLELFATPLVQTIQ